jgi:hypothetical protein
MSDTEKELPKFYGLPGAERMEDDPAYVYESEIDPMVDDGDEEGMSWEIEEWSAESISSELPRPGWLLETIHERICDDLCWDECPLDWFDNHPDAVAAEKDFLAALAALIDKRGIRQAKKRLRTLIVTWDENGEPLLDGEPMYRASALAKGETDG